jgi:hypothetical protein
MVLYGDLNGSHVKMNLHRTDMDQFLLLNRGFHSINQAVVNR